MTAKSSMEPISTNQKELLKRIANGHYRDCYLIYNRKSTDEPDIQKNSIKYQRAENTRVALKEQLRVAPLTLEGFCREGIVSERHSGFKEDMRLVFGDDRTVRYRIERPKFYRLVQWLNQRQFKGMIVLCWDRASRNKGDDHILRRLMKAGVDIRFALAHYENTSSGELHMDVDGMFAAHHARVTSEKVTLTFRESRARGIWTHKAAVGYLNLGSMDNKPQDPVRAPLIRRFAELIATDNWSLSDVTRWAIEQGFTMPPMRRRRTEKEILGEEDDEIQLKIEKTSRLPTATGIHKILTNRFYTGKILTTRGDWVPSRSHEAIIPDDLFWKVQEQLRKKRTSCRYKQPLRYALRGFVRCASCRRLYTPYFQKGHVYYGARCAPGCANPTKSVNLRFLTENIQGFMDRLSFTPDEMAKLDSGTATQIALVDINRVAKLDENERRKKKVREDLAYLNANRLSLLRTGAFSPETLASEECSLNSNLAQLQESECTSDRAMADTVKDVIKLSELLKTVALCYKKANPEDKEAILKQLVSELTIRENTLIYQCKIGLRPLANRPVANYDPTAWLSELYESDDALRGCITSIEGWLSTCKAQGP